MYNARVFYNTNTGEVYRCQTINEGGAIDINEDIKLTSDLFEIPMDDIGVLEWEDPENELEIIMSEGKCIGVDISVNPPTVYGITPEIVEPSESDEIDAREFLDMVEEVV